MQVWKSEMRKVSELIPHERNPRKISPERLKKLAERIKSQGFRVPPSVDNDGVILAGHQRVQAMIDMGLGDLEIPVSIPSGELTDKQRKEVLAADNISWGEFDMEMLHEDYDMEELIDYGFDNITIEDPEQSGNEEINLNDLGTKSVLKLEFDNAIYLDLVGRLNAVKTENETNEQLFLKMLESYESGV